MFHKIKTDVAICINLKNCDNFIISLYRGNSDNYQIDNEIVGVDVLITVLKNVAFTVK